mmetsp:Transcript_20632/g.56333  ORF Transcript_20632/g.56333 Transcript_20632/m.56333 type:complete len:422 (-) Transcript_20632:1225-2490(-)
MTARGRHAYKAPAALRVTDKNARLWASSPHEHSVHCQNVLRLERHFLHSPLREARAGAHAPVHAAARLLGLAVKVAVKHRDLHGAVRAQLGLHGRVCEALRRVQGAKLGDHDNLVGGIKLPGLGSPPQRVILDAGLEATPEGARQRPGPARLSEVGLLPAMEVHGQRLERGEGRLPERVAADLLGELAVQDDLPSIVGAGAGVDEAALGLARVAPPVLALALVGGNALGNQPVPLHVALNRLAGLVVRDSVSVDQCPDGCPIGVEGVVLMLRVLFEEHPGLAPDLYHRGLLVQNQRLLPNGLQEGPQSRLRPLPSKRELEPRIELVAVALDCVAPVAVAAVAGGVAGADRRLVGQAVQYRPTVTVAKQLALEARMAVRLVGQAVGNLVRRGPHGPVREPPQAEEGVPPLLAQRDGGLLGLL